MIDSTEPLFSDSAAAIQGTGTRPYLGDPTVIQAMLRHAIYEYTTSPGKPEEIVNKIASDNARTLLGKKPKTFEPVPGWNEPGGIDVFSAKWLGSSEKDPLQRMRHCIMMMLGDISDVVKYAAEPGVLPEQWQFQVDGIVEKYTYIFVGVDTPTQAILDLAGTAPPPKPWR